MTDKPREQSIEFAKKHLFECAKEILDWGRTSILCDGKLRELAKTCEAWVRDESYALGVAEAIVKEEALRAALAQQDAQAVPNYDKTEMNHFAQRLYDRRMQEGRHGHYESMFYVIHKCIDRVCSPKQDLMWSTVAMQERHDDRVENIVTTLERVKQEKSAAINAAPTPPTQQGEEFWPAPLSEFKEGQWWIAELDAIASSVNATDEQKRAVSVVHHFLASAEKSVAAPIAKCVELTDDEIIQVAAATKSAEPGRDGYILPVSYAHAVIEAYEKKNGIK